VDLDAYVAAHRGEWARLRQLSGGGRLSGEEADELVELYQRVATHLSVIRSQAPDPALVSELSSLVARARARVTGASAPSWRMVSTFFGETFPAAVWRARWWVVGVALSFLGVSVVLAWWIAAHPQVQASIASPEQIRQLVDHEFRDYYSSHPAGDFAFQVWTNNAWVAAQCIVFGAFLGIPVVWLQLQNALNLAVDAGLMAAHGKLDIFLGLVLPHGLLELTAVWVAGGVGLRLGWTLIDPGPRTRSRAFAEEGRAAGVVALGLVAVLLVSGLLEAFVTPSPLPTAARVGIGVAVWVLFLAWIVGYGRRARSLGASGDLAAEYREDVAPVAG